MKLYIERLYRLYLFMSQPSLYVTHSPVISRSKFKIIESKCMNNVLQSAYKQFHSTETALLKLQNDVSLNMDKGKVTALTLLN